MQGYTSEKLAVLGGYCSLPNQKRLRNKSEHPSKTYAHRRIIIRQTLLASCDEVLHILVVREQAVLHELPEEQRDRGQVGALARDVGRVQPVEQQSLDGGVGRRRVTPDRALFSTVPPDLKEPGGGIGAVVAVLQRRDGPGEEEVEFGGEGVRDLRAVVE